MIEEILSYVYNYEYVEKVNDKIFMHFENKERIIKFNERISNQIIKFDGRKCRLYILEEFYLDSEDELEYSYIFLKFDNSEIVINYDFEDDYYQYLFKEVNEEPYIKKNKGKNYHLFALEAIKINDQIYKKRLKRLFDKNRTREIILEIEKLK